MRFQDFELKYRGFCPKPYDSEQAIIHIDMDSARKITQDFVAPFDVAFRKAMMETTKYLCSEVVENVVLAYTCSDEINLVIHKVTENSRPWLNGKPYLQASKSAVKATLEFNKIFKQYAKEYAEFAIGTDEENRLAKYETVFDSATFNSEVLPITKEEIVDYLTWRQLVCIRNSIQMTAQTYYSHEELRRLSSQEIRKKLFYEKGISWKQIPRAFTRGVCFYRTSSKLKDGYVNWEQDNNIPAFADAPNYITDRFFSFLSDEPAEFTEIKDNDC